MEIIFGAIASIITELTKKYLGTDDLGTLLIVLILSLVGAGIYTILVTAGYWQSVAQILAYAGAVYAFIIRRFEE